jgi:hypothetical protein
VFLSGSAGARVTVAGMPPPLRPEESSARTAIESSLIEELPFHRPQYTDFMVASVAGRSKQPTCAASHPAGVSVFRPSNVQEMRVWFLPREFPSLYARAAALLSEAPNSRAAMTRTLNEQSHSPAWFVVLSCGRHDYGTRILKKTGNLAAVMRTMGHKEVKTAMHYQHPELEVVRAALDHDTAVEKRAADSESAKTLSKKPQNEGCGIP